MKMNNLYRAESKALPFTEDPIGDLYEDMYLVSVKNKDGSIKKHLVQSGKFYIREYYFESNSSNIKHKDIMIDSETLEDVTDPMNPIFIGCDLARELDDSFIDA